MLLVCKPLLFECSLHQTFRIYTQRRRLSGVTTLNQVPVGTVLSRCHPLLIFDFRAGFSIDGMSLFCVHSPPVTLKRFHGAIAILTGHCSVHLHGRDCGTLVVRGHKSGVRSDAKHTRHPSTSLVNLFGTVLVTVAVVGLTCPHSNSTYNRCRPITGPLPNAGY